MGRGKKEKLPVSVIIPCKDHSSFLPAAVMSVVNQTVDINEIIIIDDGDNLNEKEFFSSLLSLPSFPIRVIHNGKVIGTSASRNLGFHQSLSSWVLPMDADDLIRSDYIEKAYQLTLKENVIVYPDFQYFGERRLVCRMRDSFDLFELCKSNFMIAGSLIPKEAWESVMLRNGEGYVNKIWKLGGYEDHLFYIECALLGYPGRHLSEPVYFYRQHSQNYSKKIRCIKEIKNFMLNHLRMFYQFNMPKSDDFEFSHRTIRWLK